MHINMYSRKLPTHSLYVPLLSMIPLEYGCTTALSHLSLTDLVHTRDHPCAGVTERVTTVFACGLLQICSRWVNTMLPRRVSPITGRKSSFEDCLVS